MGDKALDSIHPRPNAGILRDSAPLALLGLDNSGVLATLIVPSVAEELVARGVFFSKNLIIRVCHGMGSAKSHENLLEIPNL